MSSEIEFFERVNGRTGINAILDSLMWDRDGLVAVVAQDARNKEVLGVAFANREAIEKSLESGLMHYYSRSRKKLWLKGEQSGHSQVLVGLWADCDGDALVAKVRQVKGNCHLGFRSCFSYRITKSKSGEWIVKSDGKKVFNPSVVYKK